MKLVLTLGATSSAIIWFSLYGVPFGYRLMLIGLAWVAFPLAHRADQRRNLISTRKV